MSFWAYLRCYFFEALHCLFVQCEVHFSVPRLLLWKVVKPNEWHTVTLLYSYTIHGWYKTIDTSVLRFYQRRQDINEGSQVWILTIANHSLSLVVRFIPGFVRKISQGHPTTVFFQTLLRWPNTVLKSLCLILHNFETI